MGSLTEASQSLIIDKLIQFAILQAGIISNESCFNRCTVHCSRNILLKRTKKEKKRKEKNQAELNELRQILLGSKGGAVLRALASHQCGQGSNPGVDTIWRLSLLLVLSLAPRGFSPGTPVFPSPQKPTFLNSNSTRNQVDEEPLCECATCKSSFIYKFICFFYYSLLQLYFILIYLYDFFQVCTCAYRAYR